jgi:hypothetical protein
MQGRKARWGRQGGKQQGKVRREDQRADKEFYKTDIIIVINMFTKVCVLCGHTFVTKKY